MVGSLGPECHGEFARRDVAHHRRGERDVEIVEPAQVFHACDHVFYLFVFAVVDHDHLHLSAVLLREETLEQTAEVVRIARGMYYDRYAFRRFGQRVCVASHGASHRCHPPCVEYEQPYHRDRRGGHKRPHGQVQVNVFRKKVHRHICQGT
ncbi:hypothetical protein IMSAGC006_02097 [Muribaculaceae bacterium]|nr:hypothetical protein IMSAGC006_02097 [Muribaculaceae bacterium]